MGDIDVFRIVEGCRNLERKMNMALTYSGLKIAQYRALIIIEESEEATVSLLARRLGITRATASVMVNELTAAGVVEAKSNPVDRRSFYVRLTHGGIDRMRIAKLHVSLVQKKLFEALGPEAINGLISFLETVESGGSKGGGGGPDVG